MTYDRYQYITHDYLSKIIANMQKKCNGENASPSHKKRKEKIQQFATYRAIKCKFKSYIYLHPFVVFFLGFSYLYYYEVKIGMRSSSRST